jgi:hypothetical protein
MNTSELMAVLFVTSTLLLRNMLFRTVINKRPNAEHDVANEATTLRPLLPDNYLLAEETTLC